MGPQGARVPGFWGALELVGHRLPGSLSGVPSLALAFLLGLCFGSLVTLALGFWALGLLHPPHPAQAWVSPPPPVAPASDRLRAYLDEQSLLRLQRRRRGA